MRRSLILLALLLLALPVFAADGDTCPDPGIPTHGHSNERLAWRCRMLCDAASGNGPCAHLRIDNLPIPWHVIGFEVKRTRDCGPNWAVDIRGVGDIDADPSQTPHTYLTLEAGNRFGELTWHRPNPYGIPQRIRVVRRNSAACTNLTVYIHLARLRPKGLGP